MDQAAEAVEGSTPPRHRVVVLVGTLDRRVVPALQFVSRLVGADVRALHVSVDPDETRRLAQDWMDLDLSWLPLHVRDLSLGSLLRSVEVAIDELASDVSELTVVVPEVQPGPRWSRWLHRHTARRIAAALRGRRRVVTVLVPFVPPPGRTGARAVDRRATVAGTAGGWSADAPGRRAR